MLFKSESYRLVSYLESPKTVLFVSNQPHAWTITSITLSPSRFQRPQWSLLPSKNGTAAARSAGSQGSATPPRSPAARRGGPTRNGHQGVEFNAD